MNKSSKLKQLTEMKDDMLNKITKLENIIKENTTKFRRGQTVKDHELGNGHILRINESGVVVDWHDGGRSKLNHIRASKLNIMSESLSYLIEDDMEKAKLSLAAKEIRDELSKIIKTINTIMVDDLMPLVDNITSVYGPDKAKSFEDSVSSALDSSLNSVKGAKDQVQQAILNLDGEGTGNDMSNFGADPGNAGTAPEVPPEGGDVAPTGDAAPEVPPEGGDVAPTGDVAPEGDEESGEMELGGDEEPSPLGREKRKESSTVSSDNALMEKMMNEKNPSILMSYLVNKFVSESWDKIKDQSKFNEKIDKFVAEGIKDPQKMGTLLMKRYIGENTAFPRFRIVENEVKNKIDSIGKVVLKRDTMNSMLEWATKLLVANLTEKTTDNIVNIMSVLISEAILTPYKMASAIAYEKYGESYLKQLCENKKLVELDSNTTKALAGALSKVAAKSSGGSSNTKPDDEIGSAVEKLSGGKVKKNDVKDALKNEGTEKECENPSKNQSEDSKEKDEKKKDKPLEENLDFFKNLIGAKEGLSKVNFNETGSQWESEMTSVDPVKSFENLGFIIEDFGPRNSETNTRTIVLSAPNGEKISIIADYNLNGKYTANIVSEGDDYVCENINAAVMNTDKHGQYKGDPNSTDWNNPKRVAKIDAKKNEKIKKHKYPETGGKLPIPPSSYDNGLAQMGTMKMAKKSVGKSAENGLTGSAAKKNLKGSNPAAGVLPSMTAQHKATNTDHTYALGK